MARIALSGELDLSTASVLDDQIALQEVPGIVGIMLDLRDLTFIDGSGLRTLLSARDRANANGHRLILVGARAGARRLMEITDTEFLLDDVEAVSVLDQFTGGPDPTVAQAVAANADPGA